MVHEDNYTGSPLGESDDDLAMLGELGVYDMLEAEDGSDVNEIVLNVGDICNGAKSLVEASEKLHDLADSLVAMSEDGWEIVDDISQGYGTAVLFAEIDKDPDL